MFVKFIFTLMSLILDTLSIYVWFTCVGSVDDGVRQEVKSVVPDEISNDSVKEVNEASRFKICVTKFISYLALMHYI